MSLLLSNYNKENRNGKRYIESDCIIRKREGLLHVCINSQGCRFRKAGSCVMCDYGYGHCVDKDGIRNIISLISENITDINSILLGTLGSILDIQEVSEESLEMIFDYLNQTDINTIILETHYTTITEEKCLWLTKQLSKKDIVVEIGLESVNDFVQQNCLNKMIDLEMLKNKINLLHKYDISVTANVFLGAPFLNEAEQIKDAGDTVLWAIDHDINSIVIFPANIRKDTLLDFLYTNQQYHRIRHWDVFNLLEQVPELFLNRVYLAWYGDWIDVDENGKINNLPPYACEICQKKWADFYHEFLAEPDSLVRKEILKKYKIILSDKCNCYDEFRKDMDDFINHTGEGKNENGRKWLQDYLG